MYLEGGEERGGQSSPEFGRSGNPIQTLEGRLCPSHYCQPPDSKCYLHLWVQTKNEWNTKIVLKLFLNESQGTSKTVYSRVRNKHSPTLINFLTFFQGLRPYSGLHRAYFSSISTRYKWGYAYSFCLIFQGLRLFKGLHLFQTLEYVFTHSLLSGSDAIS